MKPVKPVDREGEFWKICYALSLHELLKREPQGAIQSARVAVLARNIADDCERARRGDGEEAACPECGGPGCPECLFTGKADPHGGLRAPLEPIKTIPIEPPTDFGTVLPPHSCSCPDYPEIVDPKCSRHGRPHIEGEEPEEEHSA
jgi:hypothetical protein